MLWALASPPVLILAAIKLIFFHSKLSTGATALYALLALVAIGGLIVLSVQRENLPIECECPSCGTKSWFEFQERAVDAAPRVARCDSCLIYVGLRDGNDVAEVPLETLIAIPNFVIDSAQYKASVHRGKAGLEFVMPTFCAVCGAANAPHQRKISMLWNNPGVNVDAVKYVNYARTGSLSHGLVNNDPPDRINSVDVMNLHVPVCAQHQAETTRPEPLTSDDWGTMCCASYRFYKAFVVANNVVAPGNEGLPTARVRS